MAVNIVTGMTGIEHITSHDDRARNASQFGRGKYVFDIGRKFSATAVDDNLVRIQDGMCINQGTQMGIEPNDYADVEIDNGLLGTNRHDIIVMRYEKNEETLLEKASLAVVKGVNSSEPVDPEVTEGNILDGGDLVDDMPLYRVVIEGVNLVSIEPLFEVFDGDVGSILEELEDKVDKVTGKGLSTNDYTNEDKAKVDGIPTKTSDLENDSDFVSDADYVHTDNNYTNADKEDVAKIDNLEHSLSLTSTATGNPISISDSAHVNAEELTVELEPIQDLHGYDNPWVGGAGKNKWDEETLDGYYLMENGEYYNDTSQLCSKNFISVSPSTSYRLVGGGNSVIFYNSNQEFMSGIYVTASEIFTTPSDCYYIRFNLGSSYGSVYNHDVGIIYPSSETTYSPYSNICPISGYDETSVVRSNYVDLINSELVNGYYGGTDGEFHPVNSGYVATSEPIDIVGEEIYTVSSGKSGIDGAVVFYDSNGNFLNNATISLTTKVLSFTTPLNASKCAITVGAGDSDITIDNVGYIHLVQGIEPYTADTYTLQFGDTVYGAEVDFVSGVATVTKGYIAEYAGETLPSTWISDRDVYASGTTPTTGAQVVYELSTPYTIQLTPQQIKMLKGNNVLTADGDMDLTYQTDSVVGDVKEWAENEFLPKNSATAQHNYSTQEQVVGTWIDGSTLYEKTYICACDNTSNVQNVISFTDERVKIVSDAYFMNSLGHQIRMWWGGTLFWDYIIANGVVSVKRETVDSGWQSDVTFVVTIQYTKTTV